MKTSTSNKTRIRQGVAVGSAVLMGASVGNTSGRAGATLSSSSLAPESIGTTAAVVQGPMESAGSARVSITVETEPAKWTKVDARRFRELATRRALGTADESDHQEFQRLQRRRRFTKLASPNEVMAEWRRRRFVSEVLDVLARNVRFIKTEDQTRLRSLRETSRA